MSETTIIGISGGSALLALDLAARGETVMLIADDGEDLAAFGGAFSWPTGLTRERAEVEQRLDSAGLGLVSGGGPFTVVTALGQVRMADVIAPTVLRLSSARSVVVVGLRGWREWDATMVASGLKSAGFSAEVRWCSSGGSVTDVSAQGLSRRLSDASVRRELIASLASGRTPSVDFLFPPIISDGTVSGGTLSELATDLGIDEDHIGQAVASWPSLCGQQYLARAHRALSAKVVMNDARPTVTVDGHNVRINGQNSARVVIGSRRAALWLEQSLGLARGREHHVTPELANLWRCGRSRSNVVGVAEDFVSGLELIRVFH